MNPSYFRIKLNMEEAVKRLGSYKERIETNYSNAVRVSIDQNGKWKGQCLYVYEKDGWTVFEDLSGGCSVNEIDSWLKFAEKDELIFAGYNDAIIYA